MIFGRRQGILALALIACARFFFKTLNLTWYDTRLNYDYDVHVTTVDGEEYEVGRLFFSPYDLRFTQNLFWFLEERPVVTTYYGKTKLPVDAELLETILDVAKPGELDAGVAQLEERIGVSHHDPERRERLREFLRVFFTNVNRHGEWGQVLPMIPAPPHIVSHPSVEDPFDFPAEIESYQVWRNLSYIRGRPIQIRRELLINETLSASE